MERRHTYCGGEEQEIHQDLPATGGGRHGEKLQKCTEDGQTWRGRRKGAGGESEEAVMVVRCWYTQVAAVHRDLQPAGAKTNTSVF